MKEEKEKQKKKEEQLNLKEKQEKKVAKKTTKTKEETTASKEVKKTVKKAPAKKTPTKKAPAKKETTKEVKTKKTTSKTKPKAEKVVKEDKGEAVAEVKVQKKTTKKATPKTTKAKAEDSKKKSTKTTTKKKSTTSTKKSTKADAKKENKENSNIEIKEEKTNVKVSSEENTKKKEKTEENTKKKEKAKVVSTKASEKTKANNAKLEANIAKLKAIKIQETKKGKTDDTDNEEIIIDEPKGNVEKQNTKEKLAEQAELPEKKRKKKNIIIITSIITVLIIIIVLIIIVIGTLNSKNVESHDFYQWNSGKKVAYTGELISTKKDGLIELKATDENITLDSTPVYYSDEKNKVILPQDMAIVYPNDNGAAYRINQFSDIVEENGETYLETTNKTNLKQAFLYDGEDLYFFLDKTKIIVNGTTYEVSPLSYVIVRYKQNVEIYNYEKDEYQIIDISGVQDARVEADTYTINMSVDSIQTEKSEQLLIRSLSYLQPFEETIKK